MNVRPKNEIGSIPLPHTDESLSGANLTEKQQRIIYHNKQDISGCANMTNDIALSTPQQTSLLSSRGQYQVTAELEKPCSLAARYVRARSTSGRSESIHSPFRVPRPSRRRHPSWGANPNPPAIGRDLLSLSISRDVLPLRPIENFSRLLNATRGPPTRQR
jgi:hypothetical protein